MRTPVALFLACLLCCACHRAEDSVVHTDISKIASALPPAAVETSIKSCNRDTDAEDAHDALRLRMIEVESGAPVVGVDIEIDGSDIPPQMTHDATYRWPQGNLPPFGSIRVACPGRRQFAFHQPYLAQLPYALDGCKELTARIDLSRCKTTVTRTRKVRLRGMYISGFEESSFFPCDGLPPEASEFQGDSHTIWLEPGPSMSTPIARVWLANVFANHNGVTVLFADISGELYGPGQYGHFGGSLYEFRADQSHETSIRKPNDCAAPGFAERMAHYN